MTKQTKRTTKQWSARAVVICRLRWNLLHIATVHHAHLHVKQNEPPTLRSLSPIIIPSSAIWHLPSFTETSNNYWTVLRLNLTVPYKSHWPPNQCLKATLRSLAMPRKQQYAKTLHLTNFSVNVFFLFYSFFIFCRIKQSCGMVGSGCGLLIFSSKPDDLRKGAQIVDGF